VQLRKWKSLFYSFSFTWIAFLLLISIFANFIANEKPLFAQYKQQTYFPVIYDILSDFGWYQWDSELANKDWKTLDLEASWWAPIPFSPEQLDLDNAPAKPPFAVLTVKNKKFYHYLGTDELGRDIASGLIYGARYAIIIGVSATFLAALFGILSGAITTLKFLVIRFSFCCLLDYGHFLLVFIAVTTNYKTLYLSVFFRS
jgi:ABC-type microcin C transport system permease subunit YejE